MCLNYEGRSVSDFLDEHGLSHQSLRWTFAEPDKVPYVTDKINSYINLTTPKIENYLESLHKKGAAIHNNAFKM